MSICVPVNIVRVMYRESRMSEKEKSSRGRVVKGNITIERKNE